MAFTFAVSPYAHQAASSNTGTFSYSAAQIQVGDILCLLHVQGSSSSGYSGDYVRASDGTNWIKYSSVNGLSTNGRTFYYREVKASDIGTNHSWAFGANSGCHAWVLRPLSPGRWTIRGGMYAGSTTSIGGNANAFASFAVKSYYSSSSGGDFTHSASSGGHYIAWKFFGTKAATIATLPSTTTSWWNTDYPVVIFDELNTPPTTPGAFTSPLADASVNTTATVSVGASTDPNNDPISYEWSLSLDGGASYGAVARSAAGTSWTYDYSAHSETEQARWRVRAYDSGGLFSGYRYSDLFKINRPPTEPTNVTATPTTVQVGDPVTIGWQHNDPGGDPQVKYQLRWRKID